MVLAPSKDNTLYEDAAGSISNGAGLYLFVGNNNRGMTRRALITFDVAGAISAGSTITGVSLTLNVSRTQAGAELVELHRLLADWGEGSSQGTGNEGGGGQAAPGDATWVHRFSADQTWQTPGGDFSLPASASISVGPGGLHIWSSAQMVADVQGWLDDPSSNFGWILLGAEAGTQTAKRFDSKDNPSTATRPVLTVDFTPASGS